ncbi:MAG TPA: YdeI/OmpD-associated family protein [Longimicrobiales bacterium]|nr:YdeI/OmpD-associated family protein [Longimicrobiales bacterium]
MAKTKTFTAEIQEARGGGAFIMIPFDVKKEFGSARAKVDVTFDGIKYKGSTAVMGGAYMIGILKDIRAKLGKDIGDDVRVTLQLDEAPRVVEIPDDLRKALKKAKLEAAFEKLSYTHRKEHVNAIVEAKQPATRERRIQKALEMLRG